MEAVRAKHLSWESLTAKLIVLNAPVFLLGALAPLHPRIGASAGILLGVFAQYFVPPRGKHFAGLLIFALVGAIVIAFLPGSLF